METDGETLSPESAMGEWPALSFFSVSPVAGIIETVYI